MILFCHDSLIQLDERLQTTTVSVCVSTEKSEADVEREQSLIDQWVCLTEERNAVLVPTAGSGIPGAPADWYTYTICLLTALNVV